MPKPTPPRATKRLCPRWPAARVRANLGAFIQLALEADSGRYPSLARFLDYLSELARSAEEAPDESPPPAARGAVRVMTVHAAKGLEAPAVFLVNAGCLRTARAPRWLIDWPADAERAAQVVAAGGKNERSPLEEELLQAQQERESREDLNLLYVAATRARQFLHVSGFQVAGRRKSWHACAVEAMERLGESAAPPLPGVAEGALHHGSGEVAAAPPAAPAVGEPLDDPRLRRPIPAVAGAGMEDSVEETAKETLEEAAARRGTAIHALLQLLTNTPVPEGAALRARLETRLQGAVEETEWQSWLATARAVLAAPALARFYGTARAWNEVPCGDGDTGGIIDRLVDDGETLWILDYKTAPRPDPAALAARHRPQLERYAAALRLVWPGRPLRAGLVLTETRAWVEVLRQ